MDWVGKGKTPNLISKEAGSFFFIAELIVDLELEYDTPVTDHCGSCTACIDACPTEAIVKPYVVDGSKCISYLTIELKDQILPDEFKDKMDNWMFGCDICQDVCPWNKAVPYNNNYETTPKEWIKNLDIESLNWDDKTWKENLKSTTLKRIKPWMWKRNIQANLKNKKIKK